MPTTGPSVQATARFFDHLLQLHKTVEQRKAQKQGAATSQAGEKQAA